LASAAIGLLDIVVRARGLDTERIGHNPPQRGWRMHDDEITAAMDMFHDMFVHSSGLGRVQGTKNE
jgi:hypothetical protein